MTAEDQKNKPPGTIKVGCESEPALQANDERLRAMFTQAAVGIAVAELAGHFTEANQKFCDILGYSTEEIYSLTFADITHPDDLAMTRDLVQQLLDGARANYATEKRYLRKDGSTIWSHTAVTMLHREAGQSAQFIGFIEDISGRKYAEAAQAQLATIIESSDDAIITKTLDGIITSWNPAAEHMFGYTAAEIIGQPIALLIPPDHIDEEPAILERLRRGKKISHYETIRKTKLGKLLNISLSVSPLKNRNGEIVGASKIARDITSSKQVEAALREADRRKDEFIATLAHELRNPLAPIRQAVLISEASTASDAQKRWSHEVITRQVQQMSLLLDDLLDISRVTRGALELRVQSTTLQTVIDAAIETARSHIELKHHRFVVDVPDQTVAIAADPLRLAQVLANLLTNAAKYTDAEGEIRLQVTFDAEAITIVVSDSGVGIAAEAIPLIFGMFSQVKSAQDYSEGGLGIGLALAKGLVEMHSGTIEASSAGLGQGSKFTVRLPRRELPAPLILETPVVHGSGVVLNVLVADDNRDAAESLAMLLRLEGHLVTAVSNGQDAIATFNTALPDVVILDIGMPDVNGYEVARQLRESNAERAFTLIAVTGWGQATDKEQAFAAGFDYHFTKPVEPQRLIELLNSDPKIRNKHLKK